MRHKPVGESSEDDTSEHGKRDDVSNVSTEEHPAVVEPVT